MGKLPLQNLLRPQMAISHRVQRGLNPGLSRAFSWHVKEGKTSSLRQRRPPGAVLMSSKPLHIPRTLCQHRSISSTAAPGQPKVLVNDIPSQELLIELIPGQAARYPSFWLRDHCLCNTCSHPDTRQRQLDTFTVDPAVKVAAISSVPTGLEITWSEPTAHTSTFPWDWLKSHSPLVSPSTGASVTKSPTVRPWEPFLPGAPLPKTSYDSIVDSKSSAGLTSLISQIHIHGFAFIPSTPPSPVATETLLNAVGPIRHTHYGGFWDFTSEINPIDTAYTNLYLPPHTDTTYFTDPCGLQLFHLLSHVPAGPSANPSPGDFDPSLGGESTFVDGFAAAAHLYRVAPDAYSILATTPITSCAEGSPAGAFRNNSLLSTGAPVLAHSNSAGSSSVTPASLTQVRWNNTDRSPLTQFPSHSAMLQWYAAAKLWASILESRDFEIEVKLRPGEPVIFDNWRMLHGRKAFEGKRRMCGAYIGMDDFRAKVRKLGVE